MKKFFTLFAMTVMLAFTSQAAYYLVGNPPFGNDWAPDNGVEMTANANGTYSFTATINGTIWFVLTDQFADPGDWSTFNNEYRIGPTGGDETVSVDAWVTTQRSGGDHGAYKFTGSGGEYTITFNPFIWKFKIEGEQVPWSLQSCTVAGSPATVFGTEWDQNNTDNDMTKLADGTYELNKYGCELAGGSEVQFKVVANHDWGTCWPAENVVVPVEQSGIYDLKITFKYDENPENIEVGYELVLKGETPEPEPTGEMYVLGEVNGNGWDPSVGFAMDTEDQNIFTATITTEGANVDENDGIGYSYFSFTTKLAENSGDWNAIAPYRVGSLEDGYLLSEDQMGIEVGLGGLGSQGSFKVPAGTYDVTVNYEAMTMVITKAGGVEPGEETFKLEKLWEVATPFASEVTGDVRQGFGMSGKFYINNKADQKIVVVDENGLTNTEYPGGANCGLTRDEAGNLVVSNAAFPGAWVEATIKVINPETNDVKEYTVPEECGLLGRCDFIGFAKGDLMEDGALYMTGGNTGTDPFTNGVAVLNIAGGEVNVDECYTASCDGIVGQTSTVINYFKDINDEDALIYAYRSGNPSKLTWDGDNLTATAIVLPGKGHANGIFPFIWDEKEYFIYPIMPDYQNGFAIAEAGAEEALVEVPSTVAANANGYQANWLNAEVDKDGVTIYQYYPGGSFAVYRLTKETGAVDELSNDVEKIVSSVRYYNIMGQEVKEINGLTIIVTTYTDGTRSAVKVLR